MLVKYLKNFLLLMAMFGVGLPVNAAVLDSTVALVGDEIITEFDVQKVTNIIIYLNKITDPSAKTSMQLKSQVLNKLIDDSTQIQFAKSKSIDLDDILVDEQLKLFAKNYNLSWSELVADLKAHDIALNDIKEFLSNELIIEKLHAYTLARDIHISDNEVNMFLNSAIAKNNGDIEYHLRHILISNDDLPEGQTSKKLAETILDKLKAGEDFSKLAINYSKSPTALKGGDLGFRKVGEIPSIFVNQVVKMKSGSISELIYSESGVNIVKLEEIKNPDITVGIEYNLQQILLKPNSNFSHDQAKKKLQELRVKITKGDDFAKIAAEYSQEEATAHKGGITGFVTKDHLAKDFYENIHKLGKNEVSEPFSAENGWYLVKMLDKRKIVNNSEQAKMRARNEIFQRKKMENMEFFMRTLKTQTKIEILDEKYTKS